MADRKSTTAIVIHCSASRPSLDIGVREIRGWHLARGFKDIGYHVVIRRTGVIELGRPIPAIGAHVEGRNQDTVGVCLVGGLDDTGKAVMNFTPSQWAALAITRRFLSAVYPAAEWLGHRDLSPDLDGDGAVEKHEWLKQCPCFSVSDWLKRGMPVTGPLPG